MENLPAGRPKMISIGLVSGVNYHLKAIFLYPQDKIIQARALQTKAMQNLGGVSTGIGFWGSPSWAIGGALALGLLESLASKASAEKGFKLLEEVDRVLKLARSEGGFLPIHKIDNIGEPFVEKWVFSFSREVETGLKLFGPKTETVAAYLIHNGDPFIYAQTMDDESIFIARDKIESYLPL